MSGPRRSTTPSRVTSSLPISSVIFYGLGAGLVGVTMMTLAEKSEQLFTSRPNSYVPARTLERLLSVRASTDTELWGLNMAMHYGQGAAAGVIRALMSWNGIRGPFADLIFVGVRLLIDQTLENWTGVGALPWTWPVNEQVIDILHKTVFALATGWTVDRWLVK
ncbi:hypothetical protein QBC32DRAFT_324375 [Pseudoneurospora amorphoporcata]|uniref:Uncharacterized protein n=1 Tax=Pseudoneurospora amorphoporcata TaxID=241081 RepID=A0AAN6SGL0_9PEZI|nr:hypothetical protein QBC32DRAFT_324375 [Pseudoneurospora amorphoporcata]